MKRIKFICGNWKMNGTSQEALALVKGLRDRLDRLDGVEVAVCPPFTALGVVVETLKGSPIRVGAQNMHWESKGAFTGEISASMIKESGCTLVVIGHSERRTLFGETDETVNKKTKAALQAGLRPIVCVGETLMEREKGWTKTVVDRQIAGGLDGIASQSMAAVTVAYEPVWAIGTGKTATPEQAVEVHQWIRKQLAEMHGVEVAENVRIQYGGSVTPENCESLLKHPDIDGALVGGASLKVDGFVNIVEVARSCIRS